MVLMMKLRSREMVQPIRINISLLFILIVIALFVGVFTIYSNSVKNKRDTFMNDNEIERMLASGDITLFSPEVLSKVEKKEYPFLTRYIKTGTPEVRGDAISLLAYINQAWCFPYLCIALRDDVISHRVWAADAVYKLNPVGRKVEVYSEIQWQNSQSINDGRVEVVRHLILVIGNIGNLEDIEILLSMRSNEMNSRMLIAYRMGLAKLGYRQAMQEIQEAMLFGSPKEKYAALTEAEYVQNVFLVPIVATLLSDTTSVSIWQRGNSRIVRRLCDFAVNTLRAIDNQHGITFDSNELEPYTDEQMLLARQTYKSIVDQYQGKQ
jgi:hypothetical protein